MSTNTTTETTATREFIIVGQDQGTSYTLWDVAPAPTNDTKRAIALEEIGVEAMDALGEVTTVWATDARAAVDQLVADLREQSGLDDYTLSPASQMEAYGPAGDIAPPNEPYGNAETLAAAGTTAYRVAASSTPGLPLFNVFGLPAHHDAETRDRVRAGVVNSGLTWPQSNLAIRVDRTTGGPAERRSSSLDLAIACAAVAATSQLPASSLDGIALLAELGLDGKLRATPGLRDQVQAVAQAGAPAVLVPDVVLDEVRTAADVRVLGASTLSEVLSLLTGHAHHPQECVHCTDHRGPHRPCTYRQPCTDCREDGIEPVGV
ncbi:magnesium chelatase domain-containing protein [Streptomyces sulphureus]|uniref:magnesium chelatase domain-containing protein n=1 Tax=Streptomyces sulphureus TaxID=47758 RepID=UPI000378D306|nr:magnesium chelatase domain-containing protein [Streptomyces sulphureus]